MAPHSTVASFASPDAYVLRLTAGDGASSASSEVSVAVSDPGGAFNVAPSATASASYTSGWEDVTGINDGIEPNSSTDSPRGGTWPETGQQWAELTWATPQRLDAAALYFFDDGGGVRVPSSWKLQYWTGSAFVDLPGTYPVAVDKFNDVSFPGVTTTRLRAVLISGAASVGLVEFKALPETPSSVRAVHQPTLVGRVPTLPGVVTKVYADGSGLDAPVTWQPIDPSQVAVGGRSFTVRGIVAGTGLVATATVWVRATDQVSITFLEPESLVTKVGVAPALPPTVTATYNDGSRDNAGVVVTGAPVEPSSRRATRSPARSPSPGRCPERR